jgi:hypothetical protein
LGIFVRRRVKILTDSFSHNTLPFRFGEKEIIRQIIFQNLLRFEIAFFKNIVSNYAAIEKLSEYFESNITLCENAIV